MSKNRWKCPIVNSSILEFLLHLGFLRIDFEVGIQEDYGGVCPGTSPGRGEGCWNGWREKLSCEELDTEAPLEAMESHDPVALFQLGQRKSSLSLYGHCA